MLAVGVSPRLASSAAAQLLSCFAFAEFLSRCAPHRVNSCPRFRIFCAQQLQKEDDASCYSPKYQLLIVSR